MVLPGIQALFGFQLMAVFNGMFWELSVHQRIIDLIAISVVAVAIALVMTPAAYHRQALQFSISGRFIELSSRLVLLSMFPLMVGICLDFYLIASLILANEVWGLVLALSLAVIFTGLWVFWPRMMQRMRTTSPAIDQGST